MGVRGRVLPVGAPNPPTRRKPGQGAPHPGEDASFSNPGVFVAPGLVAPPPAPQPILQQKLHHTIQLDHHIPATMQASHASMGGGPPPAGRVLSDPSSSHEIQAPAGVWDTSALPFLPEASCRSGTLTAPSTAWMQKEQVCGLPDPGPFIPNQGQDVEYQKMIARRYLDALDEDSLRILAKTLEHRGLITSDARGSLHSLAAAAVDPLSLSTAKGSPVPQAEPLTVGVQPAPASHAKAVPEVNAEPVDSSKLPVETSKLLEEPTTCLPRSAGSTGAGSSDSGGDARDAEGDMDEGHAGPEDVPAATTLILRNLPLQWSQTSTDEWLKSKGLAGKYNFLLWFPARRTTRLSLNSYAFVNFREVEAAALFRKHYHLHRMALPHPETGNRQFWTLSIAPARVQGFEENYIRFYHLTEEQQSICRPSFDPEDVAKLSPEVKKAACANAAKVTSFNEVEGVKTTLILRNLPDWISSQDAARRLVDQEGFNGQYDFFIYLPPKRRRIGNESLVGGMGYAFVNFDSQEQAQACVTRMDGKVLAGSDVALSVVPAKVQGFDDLIKTYGQLNSTRVAPWIRGNSLSGDLPAPQWLGDYQ